MLRMAAGRAIEFFLPLLRFDEEVVAVPVAAGQRAGQAAPLPRFLSPPHGGCKHAT